METFALKTTRRCEFIDFTSASGTRWRTATSRLDCPGNQHLLTLCVQPTSPTTAAEMWRAYPMKRSP